MNGWERRYEAEVLRPLLLAGEIAHYDFEPLKLRLGDRCYYQVDFLVQRLDGSLEAHEVKGHWEDDARVKWRTAAEMHGWLRFYAITEKEGRWVVEAAFAEDKGRHAGA